MMIRNGKHKVLIIPDTQLPFDHAQSLEFLQEVEYVYEPTKIVHIGDFLDQHALSDYDVDPDGWSPGDEIEEALLRASDYYTLFPEVDLVLGNHDKRIMRKLYKCGIPKILIRAYKEWMELPKGWRVHEEGLEIDNVLYIHGEGFSGINGHRSASIKHGQSVVMGHLHSFAGINYVATKKALTFGFNVGSLIEDSAYAFAYAKNMPNKSVLGCGIVDKGVPHFIPMLLNKKGNWVGKLI